MRIWFKPKKYQYILPPGSGTVLPKHRRNWWRKLWYKIWP